MKMNVDSKGYDFVINIELIMMTKSLQKISVIGFRTIIVSHH